MRRFIASLSALERMHCPAFFGCYVIRTYSMGLNLTLPCVWPTAHAQNWHGICIMFSVQGKKKVKHMTVAENRLGITELSGHLNENVKQQY